jgi:hypothetical protein
MLSSRSTPGGVDGKSADYGDGLPVRAVHPRMDSTRSRTGAVGLSEVQKSLLESSTKETEIDVDV